MEGGYSISESEHNTITNTESETDNEAALKYCPESDLHNGEGEIGK